MIFRCPSCNGDCADLAIGLGAIQSKSDPRLIENDRQQMGALLVAWCPVCSLQHTLIMPLLHAASQKIETAPAAKKMSAATALKMGLEPAAH